jgi:transcriptional regulator with XRE-family HTH domain
VQRLGRRLHQARLTTSLTVREAAVRTGRPRHSQLMRSEQGITQPPLERPAALAAINNTTLAALLNREDEVVEVIATIERADLALIEKLVRMLATLRHR